MLGGSGLASGWSTGRNDNKTTEIRLHYPYVRVLQLDWEELPTGFRARRSDESRYEVICAACGDIDGPAEYQSPAVQALRGPHNSKRAAEKLARTHEFGIKLQAGRPKGGSMEAMKYMFPVRLPRFPGRRGRPTDGES